MSVYKLTYWKLQARGEPIRFLLAYGGVTWDEHRFDLQDWMAVKPTTPFGKVPMLEVDGKKIHQSVAICRYLAKQFNLVGDNDWEALQIDMAVDTMVDFTSACKDFFTSVFFGHDASVIAEKKVPLLKETVPYYFSKFEEMIKENKGYFVNGKLTWVDLYWASWADSWSLAMAEDLLKDYPNLKALQQRVVAIPAIKAWIDKRPKSRY